MRRFQNYEPGYEAPIADRVSTSIANARAALKLRPEDVDTNVDVECGETPAVRIVRRILRDAHDLLSKQAAGRPIGCSLVAVEPNGFVSPVRAH